MACTDNVTDMAIRLEVDGLDHGQQRQHEEQVARAASDLAHVGRHRCAAAHGRMQQLRSRTLCAMLPPSELCTRPHVVWQCTAEVAVSAALYPRGRGPIMHPQGSWWPVCV